MRQYSKGFTLVELVVVIAIIGILAGIAIPYYTDAQATARGAKVVADMRTIQAALYYVSCQKWRRSKKYYSRRGRRISRYHSNVG